MKKKLRKLCLLEEEIILQKHLEKLAIEIFNAGAVEFGSFPFKIHEQYPDFPLSPNKINLRVPDSGGNLTLDIVAWIAWEMQKKAAIARLKYDLVAGLPRAGEPFAEQFAKCRKRPLLTLAKEEFSGGKRCIGEIISGEYQAGQSVLVLDDVASQASTKKEGIRRFEDVGLRVAAIIVCVDREEGGSEHLQELGYRFLCLWELSSLFSFYFRAKKISQSQLQEALNYSRLAKQIFLTSIT